MGSPTELANVHHVILILQHRCFVIIDVQIVRSTEDGHDARKSSCPRLSIHSIAGILRLMSSNYGEKIILLKKGTGSGVGEEIRASSDVIMNEVFGCLFLTKILQRVSPQNITHQPMRRRFAEPINLIIELARYNSNQSTTHGFKIFKGMKLRA